MNLINLQMKSDIIRQEICFQARDKVHKLCIHTKNMCTPFPPNKLVLCALLTYSSSHAYIIIIIIIIIQIELYK